MCPTYSCCASPHHMSSNQCTARARWHPTSQFTIHERHTSRESAVDACSSSTYTSLVHQTHQPTQPHTNHQNPTARHVASTQSHAHPHHNGTAHPPNCLGAHQRSGWLRLNQVLHIAELLKLEKTLRRVHAKGSPRASEFIVCSQNGHGDGPFRRLGAFPGSHPIQRARFPRSPCPIRH